MPSDRQDPETKGKPEVVTIETPSKDDGTSWEAPLEDIKAQQRLIRTPNLKDPGYIRQKANKKLWVRERIGELLDSETFDEVGSITGKPVYNEAGKLVSFVPANSVTGWGRIRGRRVFITADDFSVRGGHADGGISMKAPYGEVQALKAKVPLIRLLDGSSGGGSVATCEHNIIYVSDNSTNTTSMALSSQDLTLGATYIPGLPGINRSVDVLGAVPVVSALLGPVVGLAAAKAALSHFSVMVKGLSQLFAAGPPVVKQATFEDLSKEALGGWEIHATNGTVDNVATSETDAFLQIRAYLSFLPSSIFHLPPVTPSSDLPTRREEELVSIIPRRRARPYDVRKVIRMVVDVDGNPYSETSSFFEIGATWGRCIVTGFARLDGRPVGVLSSDCMVNGGAIDALGSQKTTKFVTFCNHFGLPILNLVDQPGFAIGSVAERMATIHHGAAAMVALYQCTTPIYTVVLRRAFGVAGGAFAEPADGLGARVAWPSGDWGSLPLEGGVEAAYKRQLDAAPSPEEREKLMDELMAKFEDVRSPLKTAHRFGVEEIIDPRETRPLVCEWAKHIYEHVLPQLSTVRQNNYGVHGKTGQAYKL